MVANIELDLDSLDILVLSPTPTFPLDYGNRKRVHSICQQLRERGSRIHFLHYPGEWRGTIPANAIREMHNQWDSFHLIAPTRPIHENPIGSDHTVDEWWDDSIADYLKWLFSQQRFDVFLVNYTYLSKAFEFSPPTIYKILDTHDKFTNRRQILECHGINPEFFYTTADQEAIALQRPDLVWAIKEEEAIFFREISNTPILTVPHIEPQRLIRRINHKQDEDYFVIGMIGARNNINVHNTRQFLERALPIFRKYIAPIKIKIAGSMCSDLADFQGVTGVEIMGRVENVDDFYAAIDSVVVPMTFSTGLKIKVIEALSLGLPIIAHRHATEGISTTHPYHYCADVSEIIEHCLELAFSRECLYDLRVATYSAYLETQAKVQSAIEESLIKVCKDKPLIVIVINESFFNTSSPCHESTVQLIHFLKHLGSLIYYVDTPVNEECLSLFKYHDAVGQVVFSRTVLNAKQQTSSRTQDILLKEPYILSTLEELCIKRNVVNLWLLDIPSEIYASVPPALASVPTYLRTDYLRNHSKIDLKNLIGTLKGFKLLTLLSSSLTEKFDEQWRVINAKFVPLPYWKDIPYKCSEILVNDDIVILVRQEFLKFAYAVWQVCRSFSMDELNFYIFATGIQEDKLSHSTDLHSWEIDKAFQRSVYSVASLINNVTTLTHCPKFVIDLGNGCSDFDIYRETMRRLGIPIVTPESGITGYLNHVIGNTIDLSPSSLFEFVEVLKRLLMDKEYLLVAKDKARIEGERQYSNDAGWADVWKQIEYWKVESNVS